MCGAFPVSRRDCCLALGNSLLVGATEAVSIHVGRAISLGAQLLGVDVALAGGVLIAELPSLGNFLSMVVSAGAVRTHSGSAVGVGAFDLSSLVGLVSHHTANLVSADVHTGSRAIAVAGSAGSCSAVQLGAFGLMCGAGPISRKHCCLVLGNSLLVGATHAVSIHVGRAIGLGAHLLGVGVALAIGVLPAERCIFCSIHHGVLVSAGAVRSHSDLGVGRGAFDLV